jgi:hypothetical protein
MFKSRSDFPPFFSRRSTDLRHERFGNLTHPRSLSLSVHTHKIDYLQLTTRKKRERKLDNDNPLFLSSRRILIFSFPLRSKRIHTSAPRWSFPTRLVLGKEKKNLITICWYFSRWNFLVDYENRSNRLLGEN